MKIQADVHPVFVCHGDEAVDSFDILPLDLVHIIGSDVPGPVDVEIIRVGHWYPDKIESPIPHPPKVVLRGLPSGL